ncbi:MAG: hypothetical protein FWD78_07425 [Treponema sp.]|nr:hypothetical protein [Treponema sp.]
MKRFLAVIIVLLAVIPCTLFAAEYSEGNIRLVLWEKTGRFSLYYIDENNENSGFQTLLYDKDPKTSFLSVLINNRAFKLGDSLAFKIKTDANPDRPAFIFESSQLIVTQEFSFIKTPEADSVNGVKINITVFNKSANELNTGLRYVLDTILGEKGSSAHFFIDGRSVNTETLSGRPENASLWISKNKSLSLMGSITVPGNSGPDSVQFANWQRLNNASWKLENINDRNFSVLPYSINDSAVCYYFEPRLLPADQSFSASVYLALEDSKGFGIQSTPAAAIAAPATSSPAAAAPIIPPAAAIPAEPAAAAQQEKDISMIGDMIGRIDNYIDSGNITEEELAAMEQTLERLKLKYSMDPAAGQ